MYLFLDRGERKEKERERNIDMWLPPAYPLPGTQPTTQTCALTGNRTGDSLLYNPLSNTSQGSIVDRYVFIDILLFIFSSS